MAGHDGSNDNRAVRQVRDGLRRTYGVAPVRQAHPLSVAEIRTLVTGIDRATLGVARDAAFILVGYAGALRIGELAALALDDLESRPDGIVLRIRRSKTDRNAAGAKVAVARGKHPDTDPIAALQHWLQLCGATPGPVFVPLRGEPSLRGPPTSRQVARAEGVLSAVGCDPSEPIVRGRGLGAL